MDNTINNGEKSNKNAEIEEDSNESAKNSIFKRNRMGFFAAISIVIGNVVGSGIFSNVSNTMGATPHSIGISLIIWLFGGILSIFGAVCYAELSLYFKKSGGEKTYITSTFGTPLAMAFLYGYNVMVIPMATAFGALTTGTYIVDTIKPHYGECNLPAVKMIANAVIIFILILNLISVKIPSKIQIVFTIGKSLGLILIIGIGFYYLGAKDGAKNFKNSFDVTDFNNDELKFALASSLWSYEGWNTLGHVAGQVNNPKRNVPLSFITGLLIVIILYMLTVISYTATLGVDTVYTSRAIGAAIGSEVFGAHSWVITFFICLSTIGLVNGYIFTCPRISMTSGFEGEIPYVFGLVNKKTRVPIFSTIIVAINSIIFTLVDVNSLIDYGSVVSWTFYLISMVVMFYIRIRRPKSNLMIKVPLVIPFIVIAASTYIVVMSFYSTPIGCSFIFAYITIVFGLHYLPEKILHNKTLKKYGGYFGYFFKLSFDMEMANIHDIEAAE